MKVAAVILARVGSTRLKNKVTKVIAGETVLGHVINRVKNFPSIADRLVVAIPDSSENDVLIEICEMKGVKVFRGSEDDVLSRLIGAADSVDADVVYRVTADNPLVDIKVASLTMESFLKDEITDYAVMENTPLGTTSEIIRLDTLKKISDIAHDSKYREHPTLFLYDHPKSFVMRLINAPDHLRNTQFRLTLDTDDDLKLIETLMNKAGADVNLETAIKFLNDSPETASINSSVKQSGWDDLKRKKMTISNNGIIIGNTFVGRNDPPFILAEIGINHNGDIDLAIRLIEEAKKTGVHGVKFQTFKAEELVNPQKSPEYYELFKRCELDDKAHFKLAETARSNGLAFISTPFSERDVDLLDSVGVNAFKIASGEATNLPLLDYIGSKRRPVILSTGMCDLDEVKTARKTLFDSGCSDLIILHCVSRYPAKPEELNLRAIETMSNVFPETIGFSDHTEGIWAVQAAIAMGARFIEKHFTLDKKMDGPDHALSSDPSDMSELVKAANLVYKSLGSGIKEPCGEERKNRHLGRKGIYASRDLSPGEIIDRNKIVVSRPEGSTPARYLNEILGKEISVKIIAGSEIRLEQLK